MSYFRPGGLLVTSETSRDKGARPLVSPLVFFLVCFFLDVLTPCVDFGSDFFFVGADYATHHARAPRCFLVAQALLLGGVEVSVKLPRVVIAEQFQTAEPVFRHELFQGF